MNAPSISASAIESFDPAQGGCNRKWAFQRLDGVPKPSSPGAALGTRCHELYAEYLTNGTPFDLSTPEGRICHATRHLLPAPCGPMDVEAPIEFSWEGVRWKGVVDLLYEDPDSGMWTVLDHKTTSDFRYAKKERDVLLGHPQAPLYAVDAHLNPHLYTDDGVQLAWNYVKHNVTFDKDAAPGPHGYAIKRAGKPVALEPPVRLIVTKNEAEDALGAHVPTAKRMLAIIAAPPALAEDIGAGRHIARALEPNPDACDAFGGCPYRSVCGLTPQDIASRFSKFIQIGKETAGVLRGVPGDKQMSSALRDRIAQIKAERAAGNGAPLQSTAVGAQQALAAENAARAAVVPAPLTTNVAVVERGLAPAPTFGPVNPPEGAFAPAEAATPLPAAEAPTRPDTPSNIFGAPKRRGRPPGSRNKVKGELSAGETQTLCPSDGPAPATNGDTIPAPADDSDERLTADEVARALLLQVTPVIRAHFNELFDSFDKIAREP